MLRSGQGKDLVSFFCFGLINVSDALSITHVARFLDRSRFILFMGFVLVLYVLVMLYS